MLLNLFLEAFTTRFHAVKKDQIQKTQAIALSIPKSDERWDEINARLAAYFERQSAKVFCVETDRKKAVSAALDWVSHHVVTRQDLIAAAICIGESFWTENLTLEASLRVTYELNGENSVEVIRNLERLIQRAVGEGLLTGELNATVATYNVNIIALPESGRVT